MATSIFIAGDVAPIRVTPEYFDSKGDYIFSEMKPYFAEADFSIVNLEVPVVDGKPTPIKKSGPCLCSPPTTVEVLKRAGVNVVTLANNHFFDQGQNGVDATIKTCKQLKIDTVGGGATLCHARNPLFLEHKGERIVIINACEHEFSIADSEHGGSNPLDLINVSEDISRVRKEADYVILILHGGIEMYHYPTPRMKRWYRHFIDIGADTVINHHQHCVNGYEIYNGKPIFYGLGNFYFPGNSASPKSWSYGYAVKLMLDEHIGFSIIPYIQTAKAITLRNNDEFNKEVRLLNLPISDDFLLQQKFDEHIIECEGAVLLSMLPSFMKSRIVSAMVRRGFLGQLYKGKALYTIKDTMTCESHIDTLKRLLTIKTKG